MQQKKLVTKFSKQNFEENLLGKFLEVCNKVLAKHALRKSKFVQGNHSPFMNWELLKAVMTGTRLRNKFFKEKTEENRMNYNKQQNYCVTLLRKANKEYYGSLDEKHVTDNKTFWKTIKPFHSDKTVNSPKISLIEKDQIKHNKEKIAETFNTFFTNIVSNLKIPPYQDTVAEDDPITFIFEKYKNHRSIITIKNFRR